MSPQRVFFQAATGKIFGRTCNEVQMLQCIIVQSEKTYTLACVVAAAVRSAACRQQSRGAHRCMCPVFPDGNDAGRKATREVSAISATQAHPAAARHQMGWRATGQHPPGQLAAVAFQDESNQGRNSNTHRTASSTHGEAIHPPCASRAATHCGRARFSRW